MLILHEMYIAPLHRVSVQTNALKLEPKLEIGEVNNGGLEDLYQHTVSSRSTSNVICIIFQIKKYIFMNILRIYSFSVIHF